MTDRALTFDEVVEEALKLSTLEKVRLMERIVSTLEQDLVVSEPLKPRRSLLGLWADLGPTPSDEDIAEVRREMWKNFPREDI